jgi:hypothetical protein
VVKQNRRKEREIGALVETTTPPLLLEKKNEKERKKNSQNEAEEVKNQRMNYLKRRRKIYDKI